LTGELAEDEDLDDDALGELDDEDREDSLKLSELLELLSATARFPLGSGPRTGSV